MLKVRTWLTEVLLEVTNQELEDIANSVYSKAKTKQAKGTGDGVRLFKLAIARPASKTRSKFKTYSKMTLESVTGSVDFPFVYKLMVINKISNGGFHFINISGFEKSVRVCPKTKGKRWVLNCDRES